MMKISDIPDQTLKDDYHELEDVEYDEKDDTIPVSESEMKKHNKRLKERERYRKNHPITKKMRK